MTEASSNTAVLRVRDPGDLIEAIPYLLGFHPRDSLVLVGLDGFRVGVTARVDLAELADADVLPTTVRVMRDGGAAYLVAVVYDASAERVSPDSMPWRKAIDDITDCAARSGIEVMDALLVAGGRWWSYECAGTDCCPAEGRAIPGDASPAAATATYAGLVALADRDELFTALAPDAESDRARLEPMLAEQENAAVAAVLDGRDERRRRSVKRAIFAAARDTDQSLFVGNAGTLLR